MKKLFRILFALLLFQPAFPHFKAKYHVIVDMDGGMDDFRALCMMLASPEIEVMAITTVTGTHDPAETVARVSALLERFGHQGIPVGSGMQNYPNPAELILKSIELEDMPVDIVVLGPLTNIAAVLELDPEIAGKIRTLYGYGSITRSNSPYRGWGPDAVRMLGNSGMKVVNVGLPGETKLDTRIFAEEMNRGITRYSRFLLELYSDSGTEYSEDEYFAQTGSDVVPVYMLYPDSFSLKNPGNEETWQLVTEGEDIDFPSTIARILETDREDKSIIFSQFPIDPALFEEDVASIAPAIIGKHGLKEWKIVAITNEFHEHLGIYSILGAKMGLRAREYFHVGTDELEIHSFAGSSPPVSCLNDGLQVSTGGTLGHGTIQLDPVFMGPMARFSFKDWVIELSVKENIRDQIKKDVGFGVRTYGLDSPEYWAYIRELALKYWLELDRFDIFEIREMQG